MLQKVFYHVTSHVTSHVTLVSKVSEKEAVHPIRTWTDIRRRVGPYRRCFVFTHHCLPKEPLVILHVALTSSVANNIQVLKGL